MQKKLYFKLLFCLVSMNLSANDVKPRELKIKSIIQLNEFITGDTTDYQKISINGVNLNTISGHCCLSDYFYEKLKKCSSLKELRLDQLKMDTFPIQLFELPALRKLSLRGNNLSNLDKQLRGRRSNIEDLDLDINKIETITSIIYAFPMLKYLVVAENNIKIIQEDLQSLKFIEYFDVSYNPIAAVPDFICKYDSFTIILIECNELTYFPCCLTKKYTNYAVYFPYKRKYLLDCYGPIENLSVGHVNFIIM